MDNQQWRRLMVQSFSIHEAKNWWPKWMSPEGKKKNSKSYQQLLTDLSFIYIKIKSSAYLESHESSSKQNYLVYHMSNLPIFLIIL